MAAAVAPGAQFNFKVVSYGDKDQNQKRNYDYSKAPTTAAPQMGGF
jgi:hypothetical protein